MARSRLNLIGAGKLGRTLARLWHDQRLVTIGAVVARRQESARQAANFISAGNPGTPDTANSWPEAELWLLATPDDQLSNTAEYLASLDRDWRNCTVFHCSGSCPSSILAPLATAGARIASGHPIHSFADPEQSRKTFAETFCLLEGHAEATSRLDDLFSAIGARTVLSPHCDKTLYHAATTVASNLLVALLYDAEQMLSTATGLPAARARELLAPLSRQTLDNCARLSPSQALTGPLARGDIDTVSRHLATLRDTPWAAGYIALSKTAARIAAHTEAPPDTLDHIQELLDVHD